MDFKNLKIPLIVAVAFGTWGYFISSPAVVIWLDSLSPLLIMLIWYGLIFAPLVYIAGKATLKNKFGHNHTLGIMLVYFAFSIVIYFPSSALVNDVTNRDSSNIFLANEDGVLWEYLYPATGNNFELTRVLTYVLAPALFVFAGAYLLHPRTVGKLLGGMIKN